MTGIFTVARAHLIEDSDDTRLKAWAEHHVRKDPDIGWILGNFVEADNYNSNGHLFPRAELETYGIHTIASKSLNMIHHERYIVGAFAAANMLYPDEQTVATAAAKGEVVNPHVEALSGMWRRLFPDEYALVQRAHKEGTLFYSMESTPQTLTCPDCDGVYAFKGLTHDSYCGHLNASRVSKKRLDMAHFNAGALIIPPVQPGWSRADIKTLAEHVAEDPEGSAALYAQFEGAAPHLTPSAWETLMGMVILQAREFSGGERKDAAKKGQAMPGGGFPIKNAQDLKNAIQAIGRAKDPAAAKAHIKRRAKALGLENLIPEGW